MADEDKEKAEKLAAAKKRFEQLKKEQQKKSKKGSGKKKEGKADEAAGDASAENAAEAVDDTADAEKDADAEETAEAQPTKPRSESFKSPGAEVQELYKQQVAKIGDVEKENKTLGQQNKDDSARITKLEEELESLRESSSEIAELRSKAKEAERLTTELTSVQRQLAQAQQAAKAPTTRKASSTGPDVTAQLASKTSTIESLELELSNLRNHATTLETSLAERDTSVTDLTERVRDADAATAALQQELDALRVSLSFPSDATEAAKEDPEALTKRITVLESDLRSAQAALDAAAQRASSLEGKIAALTKLHRDAQAATAARDTELVQLREQLRRRDRPSHVRDASDFELDEEETEAGALQTRIRALEAENFDLRRGVWRDQRAALQPGMHEDDEGGSGGGAVEYEDVDLNAPPAATLFGGRPGVGQQRHSTFQDVITSGISAFTGRPREPPTKTGAGAGHDRRQSLGLLSDDGFDEEAFLLAQEEDAKRRIERVKEVKRGLEQWRGWRLDIADLRRDGIGHGREVGPVFEL